MPGPCPIAWLTALQRARPLALIVHVLQMSDLQVTLEGLRRDSNWYSSKGSRMELEFLQWFGGVPRLVWGESDGGRASVRSGSVPREFPYEP
jgi:hypothetical protein